MLRISKQIFAAPLGAAALALSGCELVPDIGGAGVDCSAEPGGLGFWMEAPVLSVGQTIPVNPAVYAMPGYRIPLPEACLSDLTVSPPEAGRVERDETGSWRFTALSAVEGGARLEGRYDRSRSIRGRVGIYDPADEPLVGYWRQPDGQCADPIRELRFEAGGRFSVTWTPFEVYKDYWGRYEYDGETGELTLEIESGNQIPEDVRSGRIVLDGDVLSLETASFGTPRGGQVCASPFQR